MGHIFIDRLEVYAGHGVFPEENALGQKFYVSADMEVDFDEAAENDDLEASVNYGEVCREIVVLMQTTQFKLIESVASYVAQSILAGYPLVKAIDLRIEKPQAPVPYAFASLGVSVSFKRHVVFIAVGANLGDKEKNIRDAIAMLDKEPGITVLAVSNLIKTEPYGVTDQPEFLNGAFAISTWYNPQQLLEKLNKVEAEFGRERVMHWGPRTLDLDILLFDDLVIDTETLHIPHIDMQNRLFVLEPLAEIAGYKRHPVLNRTIDQLLDDLKKKEA